MDIGLFRLSQMRLEEPEVLVETARNPVQHVGRHHVFQFLGLVDCLADRIRELRHGIGQNTDNLKPFPGIGRKLPEPVTNPPSAAARSAMSSECSPITSCSSSKYLWRPMKCEPVTFQCACLPVCMLGTHRKIRAVRKQLVEQVADLLALFLGDVDAGGGQTNVIGLDAV